MYKFRTKLEDAIWNAHAEKYKEAFDLFMQCAVQGSDFAQKMIGMMYAEGNGVEKNLEEANRWNKMAHFYLEKKDFRKLYEDKPTEECEKDAANGNSSAMLWLARCYAKGEGGKSVDLNKSILLIADAAEKGDSEAMLWYGLLYKEGEPFLVRDTFDSWEKIEDTPIPQDFEKALDWFRRACDYGINRAIHCIGTYYFDVEDDPRKMHFYLDMAMANLMRMNPERTTPEFIKGMQSFLRRVPLMRVCDRCGKPFYDYEAHCSYTCDNCHKTEMLCQACQAENISCCECGNTMRLTEEG